MRTLHNSRNSSSSFSLMDLEQSTGALSIASAPRGILPELESSHLTINTHNTRVSQQSGVSRPRSAAGSRALTVNIPGFDLTIAAGFWEGRYGTACPYYNALEGVGVAPGASGTGAGGSGIYRLPVTGGGVGLGQLVTEQHRSQAQKPAKAGEQKARPKPKRPNTAGPKRRPRLVLYDLTGSRVTVTNVKHRRGKVQRLKDDITASKPAESESDEQEGPAMDKASDKGSVISALSEKLATLSDKRVLKEIEEIKVKKSAPPMISPGDLLKGKSELKKRVIVVDTEPKKGPAYVPHSPLNLKSGMLADALKKGKQRLRKGGAGGGGRGDNKVDSDKAELAKMAEVRDRAKSLGRASSVQDVKDLKALQDREKSTVAVDGIRELLEPLGKVLDEDDLIVATNARVLGTGRYGRVVKGVLRTRKVNARRKESILEKYHQRSIKHIENDVTGNEPKTGRTSPVPDSSDLHEAIVAVKAIRHKREWLPSALAQAVLREVKALTTCSGPGVLGLVGVSFPQGGASVVTQLCPAGSLYSLIRDKRHWDSLTGKSRAKIYADLASGLDTIHRKLGVHCDVKSHNMLVTYDESTGMWGGLVGDLGSVEFLESEDATLTKEQGTSGCTAPEVFSGEGYARESDVFSFAFVLFDAVTNGADNQLAGLEPDRYIERLKAGERPALPHSDGTGLSQLISFCWKFDKKVRPKIKQVRERLDDIVASM